MQNERKTKNAEWKRKQLNYFCRNETNSIILETRNRIKKEVITYYSDTSPATAPKSDEHQYSKKNVVTPGATSFTLSTRGSYKLGGSSVVYTSESDGSVFCHSSVGKRPLAFSSQSSMDSKEADCWWKKEKSTLGESLSTANKENDWNHMLKTHHSLTNCWETMLYMNAKLTCMKCYYLKHGSS